MSGTLFTLPRYIPVNSTGRPYPLSTLTFYQAGTTTLKNVYTTAALSVAHSNPLTSNSAGLFPAVYLDKSSTTDYKAVLKNAAGSTLWTEDNIPATPLTQADIGALLYPIAAYETSEGLVAADLELEYPYFDVRRYGAVGNGSTNDAAAINTAADVVRAAQLARQLDTTTTPMPALKFGGGLVYKVTSSVWIGSSIATSEHVRNIDGDGSILLGATSGTPILDAVGGADFGNNYTYVRNLKIVGSASSSPNVGLLQSRVAEVGPGGAPNASSPPSMILDNCEIVGHFTLAALYNYAAELLKMKGGRLWNYYSTGAPALILTADNVEYEVTSANASLPDSATGTGLSLTALQSNIDFQFDGVDIRNQASALGSYNSNTFEASAIELWGVQEALFTRCFINSTVDNHHLIFSTSVSTDSYRPERIVFDNCSFHSDNGTGASIKCGGTHGSLTVTNCRNVYNTLVDHSTGQITRLMVFGCDTKDTVVADTLVGAHLIIQDALTVTTAFNGFLQTTGSGTITMPATVSGVWITHNGATESLNTGSFTGTLTGCTTSPTGTIEYTINEDLVTLEIPVITGTSNTTAATVTGMPAECYPAAAQSVVGINTDNGTNAISRISISDAGVMTLYYGVSATFTGSGTKGTAACSVTYRTS